MRLSKEEISAIKNNILAVDSQAKIYLFGSRVDDTKKGGDIDLLVISEALSVMDVTRIRLGIFDAIGEQKLDLITAKNPDEKAFTQHIFKEAIQL